MPSDVAFPGIGFVFDSGTQSWRFDIATAKAAKLDEIKAAREAEEFGRLTVAGNVYDVDQTSRYRLMAAIAAAHMAMTSGTQFSRVWTLADGTTATLTAQQMCDVGRALDTMTNSVHIKYQQRKAQLQSATTQQAISSIGW